jgi:hypothetical protein
MTDNATAAETYLRRAKQLLDIAEGASDQKTKEILLECAEEYGRMAQYAIEHVGMAFPDRKPKRPN